MQDEGSVVLKVTQADREAALAYRLYTTSLKADDYRAVEWRKRICGGERDDSEIVQAFARHAEATRSNTDALVAALEKVMPIRVNNTPDYAEVYFSDGAKHSTQAMTMNPQDWLDIEAALAAHKGAA